MKRTFNRLLLRFSFLCLAIALGAIAVAHANRGLPKAANDAAPAAETKTTLTSQAAQPIPFDAAEPGELNPGPPGPAEWSSAGNGVPNADRMTAANDSGTTRATPIAQVDYQASNADEAPPANDDGFYEGPAPDLGPPALEMPAQDQPLADSPGPDFDSDSADPSLEAASAAPMEMPVAGDQGYADPTVTENDLASDQDTPLTADNVEPSIAEESATPRLASTPRAPGNHLRGNATNLADLPATRDSQDVQEPLPASAPSATANARRLSQPPARPVPSLEADAAGSYGGGTLAVAGSGTLDPLGPSSGGTTMAIADPEPSLESEPISGMQGSGKPGPNEMEGPQTPSLTIQKSAPPEIQVGKAAEFKVVVRNVGTVAAHEVLLRDEIPHGTEIIETDPPAKQTASGAILWEMGSIKPGDEVVALMRVMPQMEGDIGSVATVSFQSSASARARCTKPQLILEHGCPPKVLVGENVVFSIKLSNPGTGAATNVVLEEDVPEGLAHGAGPQLEYAVGTLRPGETRLLELTLKAAKPGMVDNLLFAKADSSLICDHKCQFEIIAPSLQVDVDGPTLRYLERPAKYTLKVANPGTAPARGVKLVAHLPKGMKFSGANNAGYYRQQDHSVVWNLAELPAKEMGTVELTTIPHEMGDLKIRLQGSAQMDLAAADEHNTTVEGLAALLFTLADVSDPIEVGGQTTYEVKVVNQGSKASTNLRLGAIMPNGMKPISGDGPARATVDGQRIIFEPLARLAPQGEVSYKIHAEGAAPGDMRVEVQLVSDEITEPIRKEESTHVYSDQ